MGYLKKEELNSQAQEKHQSVQQGKNYQHMPEELSEFLSKNRKTSKGLKRTIEDVLSEKELLLEQKSNHKRFKRSSHGQISLPEPKLDKTNNVWRVSVPKDNSLFISAVLAYLIPVKNNDDQFEERLEKLLPRSRLSSTGEVESLRNYDYKLRHIKTLVRNYNPFSDVQSVDSDVLLLVQGLRNCLGVDDLNILSTSKQIKKISEVLKCKFRVFSEEKYYDISVMGDLPVLKLRLFYNAVETGRSRDGNYFELCLDKDIGDRFRAEMISKQFVKYFVEEFEAKLSAYHMVLEEKASKAGKISDVFAKSLGQAVGGALGGTIGFFLGSAASGVKGGASVAGGLTHLLSREIGKKHHRERVVKLLDLVYYSKEHKAELRKVLVEAGFDVSQSFEMQFVGVTVESGNRQEVLRKLAEDATNRAINYYKREKSKGLITEAIVLGESKIESFLGLPVRSSMMRSPGFRIKYKDQSFEQEWITASLYEKVGLIREQKTSVKYYKRKDKESKIEKYGYRRLFVSEDWNKIKGNYEVDNNTAVDSRWKGYNYILSKEKLESASNSILEKINNGDDKLGEERIKRILNEVKGDILAELNVLKGNHKLYRADRDIDALNSLQFEVSRLNINEYLEKFKRYFEEAKQDRQQILEAVEIGREENKEGHSKTHERLEKVEEKLEQLVRGEQVPRGPIWFGVREPVLLFTGREKELSDLHEALQSSNGQAVISQVASISGLGGVGKTELSRQYIKKHSKDYDNNIIWVNAESELALIESFKRLAQNTLKISAKNVDGEAKDIKSIVKEVYGFFSRKKSLFVFDNAEKEEYLNQFLPLYSLNSEGKKPYILLTSRNREWEKGMKVIELQEFKLEEAIEFVRKKLDINDELQDQEIIKLVEKLQCFPLTIEQAVAYIEDQRVTGEFTISDYLKEYEEKTRELLKSELFQGINNDYNKTTFTTWQVTISKISGMENGQLALEILDIIAYYAPDNVVRGMFLGLANGNEEKLKSAVRLLAKYSMVKGIEGQSVISIHRLVQEVIRINLEVDNKEEKVIGKALSLLKENFPYGSDELEDYLKKQKLLPHFEALLLNIDDWIKSDSEKKQAIEKAYVEDLLIRMADGYGALGNPKRKKKLLERALEIFEKHYGGDSFEVAKTLVNLGNAYGDLGNPSKQKELLERALEIFEKHYGGDSFEIAKTLVNLGNAYRDLGDPNKQKELLEQALEVFEKHYGRDSFEVAKTLVNLGNAYGDLGDPNKKKELLEQALAIEEKHYGKDHFEVAKTLVNLGNAYGDLGDPSKQKELLERALAIEEKHYGRDHFEVARTLGSLGNAYGDLGDPSKQKELLERALEIKERHYGRDHFEVARTLGSLGNAYGDLGDPNKQKDLLERALEIFEKHYDKDHFEVARTLGSLGNAYGDLGDSNTKKKLLERALAIEEKYYGRDHFEVARTLGSLGNAHGDLGNPNKQKELLERALEIKEKHYGRDHFEVARTLVNLGNAYGDLGNPNKQKELLERALAIEEKHYGRDHFEVARTLVNLGNAYGALGNSNKQKELLDRAVPILARHYGPNHYTLIAKRDIEKAAYGNLGDPNKQKELLDQDLPNYGKQQKAYLDLFEFSSRNILHADVQSIKHGLYLPSFESRSIKINGKCAAITRMFSQALLFDLVFNPILVGQFLKNMESSAKFYERLAQGKQISDREKKEIFDLKGILDGFEQQLDLPISSLPSSLSHVKSYKTLADLSTYVAGFSGDFALHLVTSNHVVAIYRIGNTYSYFDANVAFISDIQTIKDLTKVVKKGVEFAGYELEPEGFLVEHFDVAKANTKLTTAQIKVLTKPIQTELQLLALQDQNLGLLNINGIEVSRVALYDIGAKVHVKDSVSVLINAEMNLDTAKVMNLLNRGELSITAREYLDNLRNGGERIGQEVVGVPFVGSNFEVKNAEQARELVTSNAAEKFTDYELSKLLKSPVEQSIKALPYYLKVASSKHWPNRLTNAAKRISLIHGTFGAMQSFRHGDDLGFDLGVGEMSSAFISQLIGDGIVRATPQIIKQIKHDLLLAKGFAGVINNPFDVYDLVESLIGLSKATKGLKEWRDSIAGSVFSESSVLSSIGFTTANKPSPATFIGLGITLGQSIYSGASMVEKYKKYNLTFDESLRLFWHTFAMQLTPEDVQYIEARKNIINEIMKNVWEHLERNGVKAYATGLGAIELKDPVRDNVISNQPIGSYGQETDPLSPVSAPYVDLNELRVQPHPILYPGNGTILMDLSGIKDRNYKDFLSRVLPDSLSPNAEMFCLPAITNSDSIHRSLNDITSYCDNMIAVRDEQGTQNKMVYDLTLVKEGIIVGSNEYENHFIIQEYFADNGLTPFVSRARILGGENTRNVFSVTNGLFKGRIIGGKNSTNIVDISGVKSGEFKVHLSSTDMDRKEYVKNAIMGKTGVNEQLHISGVNDLVTSANAIIEGEGNNYTFYIKPNVGYSHINVATENGQLVFPETYILNSCNFTYNMESNKLSLTTSTNFTLDVENYLIKNREGYSYRFELIDKGGAFEPLIHIKNNINVTSLTSFYFRTKTDLSYNHVPEWYRNIVQGRDVYGVVDLLNYPVTNGQSRMIFGSSKSDVIPLNKAFYAEGGNGRDWYNSEDKGSTFVTEINNYAEDRVSDVIYIPTVDAIRAEKRGNDLYLHTSNEAVKVNNYFVGDEYKHITVVDKNNKVFIPLGSESGVKLVPFYRGGHSISRLNSEIAVDGELNEMKVYKDGNNLLLVSDKPVMLQLENFYDKHENWLNLTINFSEDKLNFKQLFELAKLAINYQDEIENTYYDSVKEYVVDASDIIICHNQKFVNGSLITVEPDDKRVGVLVLKDPLRIEASADNKDLALFVAKFNDTIVVKNWDNEDHRISTVRYNKIEVKGLDRFSLLQMLEIQSLINRVKLQYMASQRLEELDKDVVNGIRYLLSIKGVEKGVDSHRVLCFDSGKDQEEFIAAYQNKYKGVNLAGQNRIVEAVVWQIVKGYHNLPYGDEQKLLKEVFSPIVSSKIVEEIVESTSTENLDSVIESYIEYNKRRLAEEITQRQHGKKRKEVKSDELFKIQNDSNNNLEYAISEASRPSSWIGDLVSWVKSKAEKVFYVQNYASLKGQQQGSQQAISLPTSHREYKNADLVTYTRNVDINGAIMLFAVLIKRVTGQKFVSSENQPISMLDAQSNALHITEEFAKVISKFCNMPADELVDLAKMQLEIFKAVMSGNGSKVRDILLLYATSIIGPEKAKDLISALQIPTKALCRLEEKSNHNMSLCEARPRNFLSNIVIDNSCTKFIRSAC